jgi:hypothetical protein
MFDVTNDLSNYLTPNERVLWQGRGRRKIWSAQNPGLIFALIFGGVAVFMLIVFLAIASTSRSSAPSGFVILFPLLFIVIGLGVGLPIALLSRGVTGGRYLVTSAAAIIVNENRWTSKRTTILPLKNLAQISLTENRDGTGTLTFGSRPFMAYGRYSGGSFDSTPAFWNIERPLEVYQLIRKQMNEA